MPELISIKQGRGHSKNFAKWYKMKNVKYSWVKSLCAPNWISGIEIWSSRVDFYELFQKERKQKHRKTFIHVYISCKQTAQLTDTEKVLRRGICICVTLDGS